MNVWEELKKLWIIENLDKDKKKIEIEFNYKNQLI